MNHIERGRIEDTSWYFGLIMERKRGVWSIALVFVKWWIGFSIGTQ